MKKRIGLISLSVAVLGFLVTAAGIYFHILESKWWYILLAGFEAGTIGGLADWFAVSALFHEIPIPLVRRHTNIIVKNRKKITEGVVDLITNKWLAPDVIKEKISSITIAENILKLLQEPKNKNRVIDFLREVLNKLADNLDKPEVASLLQKILKDQIEGIDIATPLGRWLEKTVKEGDHNQLWEMILEAAQRTINDRKTHQALQDAVKEKVQTYKSEGFAKWVFLNVAEFFKAVDTNSIASKIIESINNFIDDAKGNPNHHVRQRFDKSIIEFAHKLVAGDQDSLDLVNNLKKRLIENADGQQIIHGILTRFKSTAQEELKSNETTFMILLTKYLDGFLDGLQKDISAQQKIDSWMKDTIIHLVSKYHNEIGNMVRESLTKLNDSELVMQIEEKVGNDLQYIRLNGAVVGSIVGVVLALLKHFIL